MLEPISVLTIALVMADDLLDRWLVATFARTGLAAAALVRLATVDNEENEEQEGQDTPHHHSYQGLL